MDNDESTDSLLEELWRKKAVMTKHSVDRAWHREDSIVSNLAQIHGRTSSVEANMLARGTQDVSKSIGDNRGCGRFTDKAWNSGRVLLSMAFSSSNRHPEDSE